MSWRCFLEITTVRNGGLWGVFRILALLVDWSGSDTMRRGVVDRLMNE